MKDEILAKALSTDTEIVPRYDIVKPDGTKLVENAELVLKNAVTQQGTPYNKARVLTDETAAKIWPTPPEEPDVNGALGNLADLAGAVVKLPIADGYEITAGDVVDVLNEHITRETERKTTNTVDLVSQNASSFYGAYIHRISESEYLVFYRYYSSSTESKVWYVKVQDGEISIRGAYPGTSSDILDYLFSAANMPDGRVVSAGGNGSFEYIQFITPRDDDSGASTNVASYSSSGYTGAIIKATDTEVYMASCSCTTGSYTFRLCKCTLAQGAAPSFSWAKTETHNIYGLTSTNAYALDPQYVPLTSTTGIFTSKLIYNSSTIRLFASITIDGDEITVTGLPTTTSDLEQLPAINNTCRMVQYSESAALLLSGTTGSGASASATLCALSPQTGAVVLGESISFAISNETLSTSSYYNDVTGHPIFFKDGENLTTFISYYTTETKYASWTLNCEGASLETVSVEKLDSVSQIPFTIVGVEGNTNPAFLVPQLSVINYYAYVKLAISEEVATTSQAIALESGSAGDSIRIAYSGNAPLPGITKGTKITSDGVNAESYADGYLRIESPGLIEGVQIACGSYIGTGSGGSSQGAPMVLTFPFSPKLVLVSTESGFSESTTSTNAISYCIPAIAIRGQKTGFLRMVSNGYTYITTLEWGEKSLSWYNATSTGGSGRVDLALNASGTTYYYVAIG